MIPADTLHAWSRLLATAAGYFDDLASESAPGSPDYLEFLQLARRCESAADYAGDEAAILADPKLLAIIGAEAAGATQ